MINHVQFLMKKLLNQNLSIIDKEDPCYKLKSIKNSSEINI